MAAVTAEELIQHSRSVRVLHQQVYSTCDDVARVAEDTPEAEPAYTITTTGEIVYRHNRQTRRKKR